MRKTVPQTVAGEPEFYQPAENSSGDTAANFENWFVSLDSPPKTAPTLTPCVRPSCWHSGRWQ